MNNNRTQQDAIPTSTTDWFLPNAKSNAQPRTTGRYGLVHRCNACGKYPRRVGVIEGRFPVNQCPECGPPVKYCHIHKREQIFGLSGRCRICMCIWKANEDRYRENQDRAARNHQQRLPNPPLGFQPSGYQQNRVDRGLSGYGPARPLDSVNTASSSGTSPFPAGFASAAQSWAASQNNGPVPQVSRHRRRDSSQSSRGSSDTWRL